MLMAAICRGTIIKEGTPFTSEWSLRSLRNSHAVYVGIYIPFISEWLRRSAGICIHNECVVQGTISAEQIAVILECLDEGEYFIPHLVGLPEKRFDTFDPQVDHPYFELSEDSFAETMESETVEVQVDELVSAFLCCKGKWEQIDPDRTMELLNILIDEKVNDEGGHGYRVVERLVELGFSKKELMVLKFAESDIDRAMQEGKENV